MPENVKPQPIHTTGVVVLLDFGAAWCPPCRIMKPIVEKVAADYKERLSFTYVDVDKDEGNRQAYNVQSIPTILLFKEGVEVMRWSGVVAEKVLRDRIELLLQWRTR